MLMRKTKVPQLDFFFFSLFLLFSLKLLFLLLELMFLFYMLRVDEWTDVDRKRGTVICWLHAVDKHH